MSDTHAASRLGILGGTFDPIHYAHLFIAEEARARFGLDRVLFVPNGIPAHKKPYAVSPAEDRAAMVALAIRGNAAFECSRVELDRAGPSYAVDTLTDIQAAHPNAEVFFITGIDAVAEVLTWKRHEEVLRLATFIAAERPGYHMQMLRERLSEPQLARVLPMPTLPLDISSTDIRQRVREGLPIRYLTPDPVVEYIAEHELYR